MRTLITLATMLTLTPLFAIIVIGAGLLGVRNRPGGVYDWAPRLWSRIALWAAGVKLVFHNEERMHRSEPCVFVSNHVSWYDIFTLLAILPRYRFVAKAELFKIPLFGPAARRAGTIPIHRENRKAAFQAYDEATREIHGGACVVVCPEGTRGDSYSLRPFKKGPFVMAIAAQAPVVPLVVYGTREVQAKGSFVIRSSTVHVHFLDEIIVKGMQYDDRDRLADECWRRMAVALDEHHGVKSSLVPARRERKRQSIEVGEAITSES